MSKTCNGCKTNDNVVIPYATHESDMARAERSNKRMTVIILALIAVLFISNLSWAIYDASMTDINIEQEIEQPADDGNNIVVGEVYYE